MKAAVIQFNSGIDKELNIRRAIEYVEKAAQGGAELVVLPEYLTYLGPVKGFQAACDDIPNQTTDLFADAARRLGITLHAGTLLERSSEKNNFYNTSLVFNPQGEIQAKYRKIHRFDAEIPGKVRDNESSVIIAGNEMVTTPVKEFMIGLSICFDLRFPALFHALSDAGADLITLPAAFYPHTGNAHWEILLRARAIENLCYILAAGQCGRDGKNRLHHGNSMIIDPWGTILAHQKEDEGILFANLDPNLVLALRDQLPVHKSRNHEVYKTEVQQYPKKES